MTTDLILIALYTLVFVVVLTIFTLFGYFLRTIKDKLTELLKREPEPQRPSVVTPLPPGYADVNRTSAVVTPKSPQQLEREQEQRIRDLQ